jgi:hypothetical protein
MWSNSVRKLVSLTAIAGLALSLTACETVRTAVGANKQPPDEFAVVTKAPLIIPPDYNLKPPKPGAPPLNQVWYSLGSITTTWPTMPECFVPQYSAQNRW